MDEYSYNAASYGVTKRPEGKNRLHRLLLILAYFLFSIGFCLCFTVLILMPAVIAVLPVLLLIFVPFTWRQVAYDLEYTVEHGEFVVEKLFNNKKRRKIFSLLVREAEVILPLKELPTDKKTSSVRDLRGSISSPDSYAMIYANKGKRCAVYFEATTKLVKIMAKYNANTTVSKDLRT